MVSTPLKNISQIGWFPQVGVNIKNIWNHHLACYQLLWKFPGIHFWRVNNLEPNSFQSWEWVGQSFMDHDRQTKNLVKNRSELIHGIFTVQILFVCQHLSTMYIVISNVFLKNNGKWNIQSHLGKKNKRTSITASNHPPRIGWDLTNRPLSKLRSSY